LVVEKTDIGQVQPVNRHFLDPLLCLQLLTLDFHLLSVDFLSILPLLDQQLFDAESLIGHSVFVIRKFSVLIRYFLKKNKNIINYI
jgi:hypothetical protein